MHKKNIWLSLWRKLHIDLWLLIGLIVISGYGLLVLYSASGGNEAMFRNRLIQVALGFAVMLVMAQSRRSFISALLLCFWCRYYFIDFSGCDWDDE
ncbi:rod shape-determining protein RodA [Pasteurella multocida subsp. multocida str. Anand1_buffalo]|nr:rod shape-determining protein RodA [Pasteurella multocida subsp. multocida str. Anand1_buffalo]